MDINEFRTAAKTAIDESMLVPGAVLVFVFCLAF